MFLCEEGEVRLISRSRLRHRVVEASSNEGSSKKFMMKNVALDCGRILKGWLLVGVL